MKILQDREEGLRKEQAVRGLERRQVAGVSQRFLILLRHKTLFFPTFLAGLNTNNSVLQATRSREEDRLKAKDL